jgi:Uma2 family endonuclease
MTIAARPASDVIYPDTDGEPMAENTIQYRYLTMIKGGLEVLFRDREDVFVAGDLFWYPVEGAPEIRTAPDVLVAIGRPKGDRGSYLQWEEGGIPPQVIFEILSPGNRTADIIAKFLFYQRYEVQEYYVYDPRRGELSGWLREEAELREIPEMQGWVSPLLGVRFALAGADLRLFSPEGRPFLTYEELAAQRDRAEAQRDHAEAQRDHAEAQREAERMERERAEAEREREAERAERLAARLRDLGVDPDA